MELARIGEIYDIRPVSGIDHVLEELESFFSFTDDANCVAVTYSFSPDVVGRLSRIAHNCRVFAGKAIRRDKVRGAVVSPAQVHFKGIMMWASSRIAYYVGSSNLVNETGGNYGILVFKRDWFSFFDIAFDSVRDYKFGDPFFHIFNEIVFRETRGICEYTGKQFNRLILDNGLFRGIEGKQGGGV